jgi:hypothetical protein
MHGARAAAAAGRLEEERLASAAAGRLEEEWRLDGRLEEEGRLDTDACLLALGMALELQRLLAVQQGQPDHQCSL